MILLLWLYLLVIGAILGVAIGLVNRYIPEAIFLGFIGAIIGGLLGAFLMLIISLIYVGSNPPIVANTVDKKLVAPTNSYIKSPFFAGVVDGQRCYSYFVLGEPDDQKTAYVTTAKVVEDSETFFLREVMSADFKNPVASHLLMKSMAMPNVRFEFHVPAGFLHQTSK